MNKLFIILILAASLTPTVYGLDINYSVMPMTGAYDETINVIVRLDPNIGKNETYAYLFWDGQLIKNRVICPDYTTTTYEYMWDLSFTPTLNHNEEGDHRIELWIESADGSIYKRHYSYTVTDGIPPFEAWEVFLENHPEVLRNITGPVGPKGEVGAQGDNGEAGVKGDKGNTGDTGAIGPKGDFGRPGLDGAKGSKGDTGKAASGLSLIVYVLLGVVISGGFTIYWTSTEEAKLRIDEQ